MAEVWVWADPGGKLRWGETVDFRESLAIVSRADRISGNLPPSLAMDSARRIDRQDVPSSFEFDTQRRQHD